MHREIMRTPLGMDTDHIDHDRLHNCKSNLRVCTHRENQGNRKIAINNTSGFKGVSFYRPQKKWKAVISDIYLGYFTTPEEAAQAYDKAAIDYYGEFAKLNF